MAKKNKTAEQDNGQAIIPEVETPQNTQPEAPPFEVDTQPSEVTTEEAAAPNRNRPRTPGRNGKSRWPR